ncbi:MAG: secretin and TonB N-terminal domain-containing protein [Deltaproteobacteria bacterium]|jgi:type IV pilus assembly protein PilQ|nr:secretin and TonB N-terminal domain-containing protein [Syntrophaceae bacterium]
MKKTLFKIIPAFIVLWIFLSVSSGVAAGAGADSNKTAAGKNESAAVGYLENVLFEKLAGRERVSLVVSRQPALSPPSLQPDNSLLVRLENLFVPDGMREPLGAGRLLNVTAVQAQPQTTAGRSWVNLKIILKESVPYSIRQEGKLVIIDFNISGIEAKLSAVREKQAAVSGQGADEDQEIKRPARRDFTKRQADRIISLDFQEADIKSVLRLMAEYGNVSIISGDDVKGNVTLSMKSVPWDQALEAILRVHGLTKQETGDVITVMTLERQRKDIQVKKAAEEEIRKAEEDRKAKEIQELAEKGKLRQILIEAKIVEASEDFVRNLGIQWGFGNHSSIGSYGLGMAFGTNPLTQTNAQKLTYPSEIPFLKAGTVDPLTMAAVNFPSSLLGPTLGIVFGGARTFIETQLSALEATTQGRVISSPKVVTMDNVKAVIKQGDEVPYVTPASGTSPATVTFKEAVLRLEVKPKITDEGRISMEIKATNDTPDYAQGEKLQGNPPIRKNEVESKVVIMDGDTVVIGGVFRTQENKIVSGVPWVYKVPILGWLFKTENVSRQKRQLMVFITPKILSGSGYVEDECDTKNLNQLDRCRNRK